MNVPELLAIAAAPAIAIILFILYRDKFSKEPATVLFISFFFGVVSVVPAFFMEKSVDGLGLQTTTEGTFIYAFFVVALAEELVKFLPLRFYSFTRKSFDEPLDGVVHGVMIAMGFALIENIAYVLQHGENTGWWRMFTAVPGHASWGVMMGYYVGKAKFNYKRRFGLMLTGYALAVFFHGLYDACLFAAQGKDDQTAGLLILAAFSIHIIAVIFAARLIRQHRKLSRGLYKNAPVLTIRNATNEDIPLVRTLAEQIWPQSYEKILKREQIEYMMNLIYSETALKKQLSENHQFIIIYNNAIPVGFASYSEVEHAIYKLHKIYLLTNQQGRGTGKFTIQQVITDIHPKGAKALRLNVNRFNKAKAFYEKVGFKVLKEEKIDIGNGYFMDDYIMEKSLLDNEELIQKSIEEATKPSN